MIVLIELWQFIHQWIKKVIKSKEEDTPIVNDNDAKVLSNIVFERIYRALVPIMMTKLQSGAVLKHLDKLVIFTKLLEIKVILAAIHQVPVAMLEKIVVPVAIKVHLTIPLM